MRRGIIVLLLVNVLTMACLFPSVFTLVTLLVDDVYQDAIYDSELLGGNSSCFSTRPQLIPKIIHQTWINESIPAKWQSAQQSCIDLGGEYEYRLWTDAASRTFIASEYPWFLPTFDGYAYPIQRADVIRYFVLAYFGGVYIDLDNGCNRCLDPLLSYAAWVHRTDPTGISNDVIGAIPQHPFLIRVIESLQSYDKHWLLPYITIMYSIGPLFLSVLWKEWKAENAGKQADWEGRVSVLTKGVYNRHVWSFFSNHGGSSWHEWDAKFIVWMGAHWMLVTVVGTMVSGTLGICLWQVYRWILLFQTRKRQYKPAMHKE